MTAGGVSSGIDLALHLLEREFGPEARAAEAIRLDGPWSNVEATALIRQSQAMPPSTVCFHTWLGGPSGGECEVSVLGSFGFSIGGVPRRDLPHGSERLARLPCLTRSGHEPDLDRRQPLAGSV